ncbi:hypothetical protein C8Q75DRAFT_348837 [Abortiporus biennis]|nr:hypothetical protein C8Q75DRAFT_348837 [Abortiporus biennis]
MGRRSCLIFLFHMYIGISTVHGRSRSGSQHIARQDQPSLDLMATSSINWWPYAPDGIPLPTIVDSPPPEAEPGLFAPTTTTSISIPSNVQSIPTPFSMHTTIFNLAPTSTTSLIHISALPPAPTPKRDHRPRVHHGFNTVYLAPIFAVLGAVLGAIIAWILLRWRFGKHQKRVRADTLPGPQYQQPPLLNDESTTNQSESDPVEGEGHFLGQGRLSRRPSQQSSDLASGGKDNAKSWISRTLNIHRLVSGNKSKPEALESEDDPFLPGPPTPRQAQANKAMLRSQSFLTSSLTAELDGDDEWEQVSVDMIHTDISSGRGLLDRIGGRIRTGHKRVDSDILVETLRTTSRPYSAIPVNSGDTPRVLVTGPDDDLPRSFRSQSHPGFRLVDEDPSSVVGERKSGWRLPLPFPFMTSKKLSVDDDNFTSIPSRRSRSPEKGRSPALSRSRSEGNPIIETPTKKYNSKVDISILPSSPPMISSPPLESQLFFGPLVPLHINSYIEEGDKKGCTVAQFQSPPVQKQGKKLRTAREPPPLPFPSNPKGPSPYRNILVKSPPQPSTAWADLKAYSPDLPSPECHLSRKERHARRQEATSKVAEILARSWSDREMRGQGRPISPTLFGALSEGSPLLSGGEELGESGIEERLERFH